MTNLRVPSFHFAVMVNPLSFGSLFPFPNPDFLFVRPVVQLGLLIRQFERLGNPAVVASLLVVAM
jgi:hypothetical protein